MALDSPAAARHAAQSVLSEPRFHGSSVPNPLHGALEWLGQAFSDPVSAVERLVDHLGGSFAGGVAGVWALAGVLVLVAAGVLASRRARTRIGAPWATAGAGRAAGPEDLERQAAAAEQAERWNDAVRLRFRAGILRLGQRLELSRREAEAMPNRMIARRLRSPRFEDVSAAFEEIAYGAGTATAEDAERQRSGWPEILAELGEH